MKLKASDLRIGNLVFNFLTEKYKIVSFTTLYHIKHDDPVYVQPIHLTPEILEKAGFKKLNNAWNYGHPFSLFDHNMQQGELNLRLNDGFLQPEVKYVHQLQNLYYALTGEELTIIL